MSKKEYFTLDKILSCDSQYIIFLERRLGVKLHAIKDLQRRKELINENTKRSKADK